MEKFRILNWRRDKIALLFFALFYVVLGAALSIFQERFIYHPDARDFESCGGFADAEKINFKGTRMYFKKTGQKIAVLYHGNAGSACDRDFFARIFENNGYSYLIPEYAGYSGDLKKPSHEGVKNDARNVIEFLETQNFSAILVAGESVGSGPASYHASIKAPDKLLLITPFTTFSDIAREIYWFYPVSYMVNNAFDNIELLRNYKNEALVIHGDKDDIIPTKFGKKLFESILSGKKEFISLPDVGHNDLFASDKTYDAISNFLKK